MLQKLEVVTILSIQCRMKTREEGEGEGENELFVRSISSSWVSLKLRCVARLLGPHLNCAVAEPGSEVRVTSAGATEMLQPVSTYSRAGYEQLPYEVRIATVGVTNPAFSSRSNIFTCSAKSACIH